MGNSPLPSLTGGVVRSVHRALALRGPREQATALPPDATGHSALAPDRTWQKLASPAERRGAQRHRSPTPRPRPFLPSRAPRWLGRWAAVGADSDRAWSRNAAPWGVGGMACRNHVRVPPTLARIYISASAPPSAVACMHRPPGRHMCRALILFIKATFGTRLAHLKITSSLSYF